MRRQIRPALGMLALFTVITGLIYPLLATGVAQAVFNHQANGSLITRDGQPVGSELIGQDVSGARWFHPRPSASGYTGAVDGEPIASSGSNLGPSNPKLLSDVASRVATYRAENGLGADAAVPVDAVTVSASGLDPEISVANARLQAPRVAAARGLPVATVLAAVDRHTTGRALGVLGEPGVNVLELNLDLDGAR